MDSDFSIWCVRRFSASFFFLLDQHLPIPFLFDHGWGTLAPKGIVLLDLARSICFCSRMD